MTEKDIKTILDKLELMYPDAHCELDFKNVFQLLIAVVLSAQTTDKSVNKVTPELFRRYPDPDALAAADPDDVAEIIRSIGMYRTKSGNIVNLSKVISQKYDGKVPGSFDELVSLPGVGRKTASVVLSEGFGVQIIAVDTHVFRVSNRIGLVSCGTADAAADRLMEIIPEERRSRTHHSLIFHGRRCCSASKPKCDICGISGYCTYYKGEHRE